MATEAMQKLQTAMELGCEGTNYYDQWADTYEEVSHNLIQGLVITPIYKIVRCNHSSML